MERPSRPKPKHYPRDVDRDNKNIYNICQITKQICLPFACVGRNIHQTLETTISRMIEGQCIIDGFVKRGSVKIITYSSGTLRGENVRFDIVFNCMVCYPVAGMLLNCVAKNITKAGIRAESADETPSPFVLFIARDHSYANQQFAAVEEGQNFTARVIAQRFELNDKYISVIASVVKEHVHHPPAKPRLNLGAA